MILLTSLLLIFGPAAFFFLRDFAGMPIKERTLCALFQSVTTRKAGFNTANLSQMTGTSQALMIVLMMIGGAPGSTAGGMKITTFAVLAANASATFRQREDTQLFGRRVGQEVLKNASTILMLYLFLVLTGGIVISVTENLPVSACLFETASAVGTVGLTLVYAAMPGKKRVYAKLPLEKNKCRINKKGKRIKEMKNILLIGVGRFGRHIAMHLNQLGHQVMAVDRNEERIDAVCDECADW